MWVDYNFKEYHIIVPLYKRSSFVRIGSKNKKKSYTYKGEQISLQYESGFIKPQGKICKRQANKKVRKSKCYTGTYYKKIYGWCYWS